MPTIKKRIIKYGLALTKDSLDIIPFFTIRIVAIGISKATPNANISLNTKLRY